MFNAGTHKSAFLGSNPGAPASQSSLSRIISYLHETRASTGHLPRLAWSPRLELENEGLNLGLCLRRAFLVSRFCSTLHSAP